MATTKITPKPLDRPLYDVARDIWHNWPAMAAPLKVMPGGGGLTIAEHPARPYVNAMAQLDSLTDSYGHDQGAAVVRYFLTNAAGWRGEVAQRVKAELKAALADYDQPKPRAPFENGLSRRVMVARAAIARRDRHDYVPAGPESAPTGCERCGHGRHHANHR